MLLPLFIQNASLTLFSKGLSIITYMIGYVGALFVRLGAQFTNWALDLNMDILQSHLVKVGWIISRDIANLGFVLAIILIAFTTILRVESYAMKQTLWKLITAALLVNFSLVLAGVFIDFSGMLTNFFITKAAGNPANLALELTGAFRVHEILQPTDDINKLNALAGGLMQNFSGWATFFASLFFAVFFTGIAAITLIGLAGMLFIRYIALSILLILMPIAWLLWIWSDTKNNWTKWWQEFFRWIWFAPALSFFLYLAFSIVTEKAKSLELKAAGDVLNMGTLQASSGEIIGQMFALMGILIGGLIAANSMGIAGAGLTMGVAKGFKNFVTGTITGGAGLMGRFALRRALTAGAGVDKEGKQIPSYAQRLSNTFSKGTLAGIPIPGLKGAGAAISRLTIARKEEVSEYQKNILGSLSDEAVVNRAKSPTAFVNPVESAAIANELTKRNLTEGLPNNPIDDTRITEFMKSAQKMGVEKDILKARPDLAPKINIDIKKIVEGLKAKEADDICAKALENLEVSLALSTSHLEQIIKAGTNKQKAAIAKILAMKAEDVEEGKRIKLLDTQKYIRGNTRMQPFLPKIETPKPPK
jgi:hypothetical protein